MSIKKDLKTNNLLIGAHTSASGGLHNAVLEGVEIQASTIQVFTANQKQWKRRVLTDQHKQLYLSHLAQSNISSVMSHAGYLINPGSPNEEILKKSRICMREEIRDCMFLDLSFVNFHPGAATTTTKEQSLEIIIQSFLEIQNEFNAKTNLTILLETTAGQGSLIGSTFEELAYLINNLKNIIPIGICLDTCHIFAAGYDIRTKKGLEQTIRLFDQTIGLNFLKAIHLNDSVFDLSSKKDRHADLGCGKIGIECFKNIMQHQELRFIPKYLETPSGPAKWKEEIDLLRSYSKE